MKIKEIKMKALIRQGKGKNFSNLKLTQINLPELKNDEVRVQMKSSRINPADLDLITGMPFLKSKPIQIGGVDGAGTVIALGSNVSDVKVGDEVIIYRTFSDFGTWADEINVSRSFIFQKPKNLSIEIAGAQVLPMLTAYQALQKLNAPQKSKIFITGAGGGVGFQAVQFAIAKGLTVIALASQKDKQKLIDLGVTQIIDYKTTDFELELKEHKVSYILDFVGKETLLKAINLKPKVLVSVHYIDPLEMKNVGVSFPKILQFILKLTMLKYRNRAHKFGVKLISQITGPDQHSMLAFQKFVEQISYQNNTYETIHWKKLESIQLDKNAIGKVIVF